MLMIASFFNNLIWTQAPNLVFFIVLAAIIGWLLYRPILYTAVIIFLACFFFFRNPTDRVCPEAMLDKNVIVCPADGHVVDISHDPLALAGYHQKVSIFLSPIDVHVNWTPIGGKIESINYVGGKFIPAFLPKSSELNEHNDVIIRHISGKTVLVRQIAGTLARRICCWLNIDQKVKPAQKYGMIKFSSRVDVFLPAGTRIDVKMGQSVIGGCTVLGSLGE
jgi:phosphatidylserine decarboxylase